MNCGAETANDKSDGFETLPILPHLCAAVCYVIMERYKETWYSQTRRLVYKHEAANLLTMTALSRL